MIRVKPFILVCVLAATPLAGFAPATFAESAQAAATTEAIVAGPVNLNTASAEELAAKLHGIGQSKAEAIVAHRDAHGPFTAVEQLLDIKGIGQATLDRNRDIIQIN